MTIDDVAQDLKQKVQLRDIQWVEPLLEPVVIGIHYTHPRNWRTHFRVSSLKIRMENPAVRLKLTNTAILWLFPLCMTI